MRTALAAFGVVKVSKVFCSGIARVWFSWRQRQKVKFASLRVLLQTVVAVALFFLASLNSFTGSGWLAVSQLTGFVFNKKQLAVVRVCQCGKPRKSGSGC